MDEKISYLILRLQRLNHLLLINKSRIALPFLYRLYNVICFIYGCYVPITVDIGHNIKLPHGLRGVYFSADASIGSGCIIYHQVTIGSNYDTSKNAGSPKIGNNVFIGVGAKIIGRITVGEGCRIGANCVVTKDVPAGYTCVLPQTRLIAGLDRGIEEGVQPPKLKEGRFVQPKS